MNIEDPDRELLLAVGWTAAYQTNLALAEQQLGRALPGAGVGQEADIKFTVAQEIAAAVMGRVDDGKSGCPLWSYAVEPWDTMTVGERWDMAEAFLLRELPHISDDYHGKIITSYQQWYGLIARNYQATGMIPFDGLPPIEWFKQRLDLLAPTYEYMQQMDWQPELVFVPRIMGYEHLDGMLKGYLLSPGKTQGILPYGDRSQGAYAITTKYRYQDQPLWDVVVMNRTNDPAFTGIDLDQDHSEVTQALQPLIELARLGYCDWDLRSLAQELSPDFRSYACLQLMRLDDHSVPLDANDHRTMGRETATYVSSAGEGAACSQILGFDRRTQKVATNWGFTTESYPCVGLRPTVSGNRLLADGDASEPHLHSR